MQPPAVRTVQSEQHPLEVPDGLRVWELLRRLLLEHYDEADDTEAQVAFAATILARAWLR